MTKKQGGKTPRNRLDMNASQTYFSVIFVLSTHLALIKCGLDVHRPVQHLCLLRKLDPRQNTPVRRQWPSVPPPFRFCPPSCSSRYLEPKMADIGMGGYTAHIRGYYRLLAHPTSFPGQWHPNHPIRWDEAMRLRPPQPDSPSSGSSANWALNPLYALPHPNGSAHSTPLPA